MISVFLQGGLGNQMFQIFAYLNFCIVTGDKIIIPKRKRDSFSAEGHPRGTYWENIFKKLKIFLTEDYSTIDKLPCYNEPFFHYYPLAKYPDTEYKFRGYFQSYKYFINTYEQILDMLNIRKMQKTIKEKYTYFLNDNTISLHFRIGDYKNIQDSHPVLCNQYYINSLDAIIKKMNLDTLNVLVFFEEVDDKQIDIKIKILKKKYKNINFIKIDYNIEDWKQLLLMSCCQHNIIANSSFSWWGAYLNDNKEKNVYYPDVWFGKKLKHNLKDLHPPSWIKISNK